MSEKRVNEDNLQGSWVELHYCSDPRGGAAAQESLRAEAEAEAEAPGSTAEGGQVPGSALEEEVVPGATLETEELSSLTKGGEQVPCSTLEVEPVPGAALEGGQVPGVTLATAQPLIQGGDLEKMLLDAQHESGRSSSRGSVPCDSPTRPQTPLHLRSGSEAPSSAEKHSSQSDEDYLERRQEVENLMKKNADWIWDWSSRPENLPPREFLLKHPKRATPLSIRNTRVMKKGGIFSADFLRIFLPSLLLSHILAIGLGVYIGRRLTPPSSSF